ncbi:PaaI family thioesterase [Prosthecomicrobium sp. N25]|uniref:PaaI family thioesterase n=1 Tax=Prosthecomicrobium sp. N25 TaxID=3129254 RepID=UPI003077EEAF
MSASYDPAADGWDRIDQGGFESFIGPFWQKREPDGRIAVGLMTRADHMNRNGVVHGGVTLAMADQALGLAAYDDTGGLKQATIQLDVHFTAPVRIGSFLECRAVVTRRAKGVMFMAGTLTAGGRPVATAQGIWKIAEG